MSFEIKECGKNIGLSIVENCTSGFFKGLVEIIEDRAKKKSERNNALEGVKSESIKEEVDIPVKFVGLGEGTDDLEPFDIEKYIYGLFKDL